MWRVSFSVVASEDLPHNPANPVTAAVERVSDASGATRVRNRVREPAAGAGSGDPRWAASSAPAYWNFWRREADIRRPTGEVVLLDWAFAGDGAVGEDLGNHVPDAALDLFWPVERLPELDAACTGAHLEGLRESGWSGEADLVRLGTTASVVKYAWLLPLMLARAGEAEQRAYQRSVDAERLYAQRGIALTFLVGWCDEALEILDRHS